MSPDIEAAVRVAKAYRNPEKRDWLGPVGLDSYETDANRAEFYVLEGSPPRGFIVATAYGQVMLYDSAGKLVKRFYASTY